MTRTTARQNRTQSDIDRACKPDRHGHTPLGVSGCPTGLSVRRCCPTLRSALGSGGKSGGPPRPASLDLDEQREFWAPALVFKILRCGLVPSPTRLSTCTGEVGDCLGSLKREDKALILMRATGVPWKVICRHLAISRATAHRRLDYLLTAIAWKLNGRVVPARWSRRYLLDRERELSSELERHPCDCVRHIRNRQRRRAVRSTDEVDRADHEVASISRCRGKPANREVAAEERGQRAADSGPPGLAERSDQAGKG